MTYYLLPTTNNKTSGQANAAPQVRLVVLVPSA
jgi:hypothetical protein